MTNQTIASYVSLLIDSLAEMQTLRAIEKVQGYEMTEFQTEDFDNAFASFEIGRDHLEDFHKSEFDSQEQFEKVKKLIKSGNRFIDNMLCGKYD